VYVARPNRREEGAIVTEGAEALGASSVASEMIDVEGGAIHLLRGGEGPPLLFLHGGGIAGVWLPLHGLLAEHFEVFAPDHPGFGKSDDLPQVEAIDDLVYHYLGLLDRFGLERVSLMGASFGGWLAAELAVHSPHRFDALVLVAPVGLRIPEHPIADLFYMSPAQKVQALFHDPAFAATIFPAEPDVDFILQAYRNDTALARYAWHPFMNDPKLERRLGRITIPTLVLASAQDQIVPRAHGERYAERIAGAKLEVLENAGHAVVVEEPARVAELAVRFLAEVVKTHAGAVR
jgi:pimeloyl-ACP methyl ester carboxylesterase